MGTRRTEVYADDEDLRYLLRAIDEVGEHKFVEQASVLNRELRESRSSSDLFEQEVSEMRSRKTRYFVFPKDAKPIADEVQLSNGSGVRYTLNQYKNADTAELRLGGDLGDRTVAMSEVCTIGTTDGSIRIYETLAKLVRKSAHREEGGGKRYLVMSGALEKLRAGWRLAREKSHPRSMDPVFDLD